MAAQRKTHLMPRRSPPPPPSKELAQNVSSMDTENSRSTQSRNGNPLGTFWSTQHAQDSVSSQVTGDKGPVFDEEPIHQPKPKRNLANNSREQQTVSPPRHSVKSYETGSSEDFEIRFSPNGSEYGLEKNKPSNSQSKTVFQDQAFNAFVAEFDTNKFNSGNVVGGASDKHGSKVEDLESELSRLKQELKQVNLEKQEMTAKYEKLTAICRSQRQEIQELKRAIAAASSSPAIKEPISQSSPGSSHSDTPVLFSLYHAIFLYQKTRHYSKDSKLLNQDSFDMINEFCSLRRR